MDNRRVKFCLKTLSRFGKIIRKPQGVKFFGAPCSINSNSQQTRDETVKLLITRRTAGWTTDFTGTVSHCPKTFTTPSYSSSIISTRITMRQRC